VALYGTDHLDARTQPDAVECLIGPHAGYIMPNPTKKYPNHHRLIHPDGVAGFSDENPMRLSEAFTDTGELR
jgi:hypothetical protein